MQQHFPLRFHLAPKRSSCGRECRRLLSLTLGRRNQTHFFQIEFGHTHTYTHTSTHASTHSSIQSQTHTPTHPHTDKHKRKRKQEKDKEKGHPFKWNVAKEKKKRINANGHDSSDKQEAIRGHAHMGRNERKANTRHRSGINSGQTQNKQRTNAKPKWSANMVR